MVVMLGHLVNSSTCELIDALNMETNSTRIFLSSFNQKDEVCFSPIHPFEIFFVSLFKQCIPCSKEVSSRSGRHLNLVYVKREVISPYVFNNVHCSSIRINGKVIIIIYFYNGFLVPILTQVILYIGMVFKCRLHWMFDFT